MFKKGSSNEGESSTIRFRLVEFFLQFFLLSAAKSHFQCSLLRETCAVNWPRRYHAMCKKSGQEIIRRERFTGRGVTH